MDPQSGEALSSVVYPTMEGGASPLPESDLSFSDDWNYQYFVIVPMSQIKPYNHEVVSRMIHRLILKELGDFDRDAFPPFLESWSNPMSMCIKIVCNRKVFQRISRECQQIFLGFGGSSEMLLCYQTSGAIQWP